VLEKARGFVQALEAAEKGAAAAGDGAAKGRPRR
jgi:hypothetical protein